MRIVLSFQEIAQWRSQLFAYTDALQALDEIENCRQSLLRIHLLKSYLDASYQHIHSEL